MTKQEQIEEMAKIIDEMYNVYTTTADDIADGLYNAGYRKTFASDKEIIAQKEEAVKEFAEKLKTRFEEKEQHYICMYDWNGHSAVVDCANEVDELLKENEK